MTHAAQVLDHLAGQVAPNPVFQAQGVPLEVRRAQYVSELIRHDWLHRWSDSWATVQAGKANLARLREMQRELDPGFELWNKHCHPDCRDGRTSG